MRTEKEVMQDIIRKVYEDTLNTCNELTLYGVVAEGLTEIPLKEFTLEWVKFKSFLEGLPKAEDLNLDSDQSLREQLEPLIPGDSHFEKRDFLDDMLFSLWKYIEDFDKTFDLGDDGTDEAEMQKDMLMYLILDILSPSTEVLIPEYLARNWIKEEYMDDAFPPMWVGSSLKEELAETIAAAPVYSNPVKLWLEKEMGYVNPDDKNCSIWIKK